MSDLIDARGISCPEPVIMTKNSVDSGETNLTIMVDTNVAVENITRFAKNKGFKIDVSKESDYFKVHLNK